MNPEQARQILLLYRPGATAADVPELTEALALVGRDPGLQEWFDNHCAVQEKIARSFRAVSPPEGLREQIISEQPARAQTVGRKPMLAVTMAVLVIFMVVAATAKWLRYRDATGYAAYRQQMVSYATGGYGMSLTTNDLNAIHGYLAEVKAPSDYTLPDKVEKLEVLGCMTPQWQAHPVSLICLRAAAKPPVQTGNDVWLFVADRQAAYDAPATSAPKYAAVGEMGTASWSDGGQTYLLVAQGGRPAIKELLGDLD